MAAIGGSILSVSLDGSTYAVAADADVTRKIGGFENEVLANGDGTARIIKTRVPFMIGGLTLSIDDVSNQQADLQALADKTDFFPGTITFASGATWSGSLMLTGELSFSSNAATASVELKGMQTLDKQ